MTRVLETAGKWHRDEPLSRHSSFKIGGRALYFSEPGTQEELAEALEFADAEDIPNVLMGNASNILFSDENYDGLAISLADFETDRLEIEGNYVRVSAGMGLIRLAYLLADHALGGMEFVGTIPGTVGGALVMNAGFSRHAHKLNQISDWLVELKTMGEDGTVKTLRKEDVVYSYRSSNLRGQVILEATFKLNPVPREDARRELRANQEYRESVQELRFPSAGSIFKNPGNGAWTAGKLIDQAGLKGFQMGGAQISHKHGNFIINLGYAKARDVLSLIELAQEKVRQMFEVDLELEVQLMGVMRGHNT